MEKEILGNIETRLEKVREKVFDDLFEQIGQDGVTDEKLGVLGWLHEKLLNTVLFYKRRIDTKKKMREIVHRAITFNLQDFETLAQDFNISIDEAKSLIELLKGCFDQNGRFIKGAFAQILPECSRYERNIFEFLWHYLREYIHQKDRTSYLNSLQLLIAKMQRPKSALKILLTEFCLDSDKISYADSKALMLCSLLVRKYNKGLIDVEITPEDVLRVEEGLDKDVANYAAWKVDKEQDRFFDKIKTIHQCLVDALSGDRKKNSATDLQFLISLEREAYIFFSLVGGASAHSILLSVLKEYGDSESRIYRARESRRYTGALLQNLRIVVRGLGRVGGAEDLPALDSIKDNRSQMESIESSERHKLIVDRIVAWTENAKQKIIDRNHDT
jgi:hypothetical protein